MRLKEQLIKLGEAHRDLQKDLSIIISELEREGVLQKVVGSLARKLKQELPPLDHIPENHRDEFRKFQGPSEDLDDRELAAYQLWAELENGTLGRSLKKWLSTDYEAAMNVATRLVGRDRATLTRRMGEIYIEQVILPRYERARDEAKRIAQQMGHLPSHVNIHVFDGKALGFVEPDIYLIISSDRHSGVAPEVAAKVARQLGMKLQQPDFVQDSWVGKLRFTD